MRYCEFGYHLVCCWHLLEFVKRLYCILLHNLVDCSCMLHFRTRVLLWLIGISSPSHVQQPPAGGGDYSWWSIWSDKVGGRFSCNCANLLFCAKHLCSAILRKEGWKLKRAESRENQTPGLFMPSTHCCLLLDTVFYFNSYLPYILAWFVPCFCSEEIDVAFILQKERSSR